MLAGRGRMKSEHIVGERGKRRGRCGRPLAQPLRNGRWSARWHLKTPSQDGQAVPPTAVYGVGWVTDSLG